jgi:hypothetical protein
MGARRSIGRSRLAAISSVAFGLSLAFGGTVGAAETVPDVCLAVHLSQLPSADAWPALIDAVDAVTSSEARPSLFPDRQREVLLGAADTPAIIGIWSEPRTEADTVALDGCVVDDAAWSSYIGRAFLADGADRILGVAPTTPGIDSNVEVEWYPDEHRVRTWLEFEGPLGIPNGTCWVDDVLTVEAGLVAASGDTDLRTSPFAESACGRFFDYLPRGGAGEQAVMLLPVEVSLPDGSTLVFVTTTVDMDETAIRLSGAFEVR